jgi:hypothetical protein
MYVYIHGSNGICNSVEIGTDLRVTIFSHP